MWEHFSRSDSTLESVLASLHQFMVGVVSKFLYTQWRMVNDLGWVLNLERSLNYYIGYWNIKNDCLSPFQLAVFIGPILAVLFSVFGFCTRYVDITPLFQWMWHISYYRASFHGILNSVYGMNRDDLFCPETQIYCHFKNPVLFQKDMDIEHVDMEKNFILIVSIVITMYIGTLFVLWYKLNKR